MEAKKSLGQHWLKDEQALEAICQAAGLQKADIVLEVGPGHGDLTRRLVKRAGSVIAIELDADLAAELKKELDVVNLEIINQDIRRFDLTGLPLDYKVVANIPYYLTSHLIRLLSDTANQPKTIVLLVQQEVAERLAAAPGKMSLLGVSAQYHYTVKPGPVVAAQLFEPPPKVHSQVIILQRRPKHLFGDIDTKAYFRLVKAGFAGRRKKLRGSLSAGLHISKDQAAGLLKQAGISPDKRAQELSLEDWHKLYKAYSRVKI